MMGWGRGNREGGTVRPTRRLLFSLPLSTFPLLLLACTAITVRPTYRPFPLAGMDTLTAMPPEIISAAGEEVKRLGLEVRVVTAPEGYLETRWFDLRAKTSRSSVANPDHTIRVRVWADLITPLQSQLVVETVQRRSLDPSVPEREDETVVAAGTPADSVTRTLRAAIKARFDKGGKAVRP